MAANNSYQEAVALIAAANRVVQDPNSVGAALRTISLRLRGTSTTELEEAGEDTTGAITSKSKLRSKIKTLSGVDILTDTGAYKSTYQVLLEISKIWKDMSDVDQAALLELIAGKNRANTAAAILSNTKDLQNAYQDALNAEGSAYAENERYLDSIQGKIDQFTNAVQTMWNNTLDDSWVKIFVDIGTWLVKLTDQAGLLKVALTGIITLLLSRSNVDVTTIPLLSSLSKVFVDIPAAIKEKFKKQNIVESVLGDPQDIQLTVEEFSKELKDSFIKYNDIDTFDIDSQIMDVEQKLQSAQKRLLDAKSRDWDYYKQLGSQAPAFDRDTNILNEEADVNSLRNQLMLLRGERDKIINTSAKSIAQSIFDEEDAKKAENGFNSIMSVLDQIKGKKLEFGDADDVAAKIDGISDAAAKGQVELGKYVGSLEDGDIALKAYVASVKDGQYTVAGYNDFIRAHNTELQALNKTVDVAIVKQKLLGFAINIGVSLLITNLLSLAAKGISYLSDKLSGVSESFEDLQDEFDKTNSELSNCKSELNSLESELETTKDKIDELQSSGSLTFVEQEELKKLKETSAELERQIDLKSQLQTNLQKGTNAASINATNKYLNTTSFSAEDTKTERSEKNKETGKTIGQVAGTIIGGIIGGLITLNPMGALAGAGIGGSIGGGIGGAIGSGVGADSYNKEQTVKEALDNMATSRKELIKARDEAYQAYINNPMDEDIAEEYENAEEALNKYDSKMAEHINQIQSNYSAMDWETATEQQKQDMIEMADILDKYNIEMGGTDAKANAIERIFGEEADSQLQSIKKGMQEAAKAGQEFDIADFFNGDEASYNAFVDRLRNMDIYLYEVENYFKDVAAQADEFAEDTDLSAVISDIKLMSDGLGKLKSAFDEVQENGFVAADTLNEMKELFGDTEGWDAYCNAMFSGVTSTKEMIAATEELATAYLKENAAIDNVTKEQKWSYIIQLRNIGVENAEEVVSDAMEESMYAEIEKSAKVAEEKVRERFNKENEKMSQDKRDEKWNNLSDSEIQDLAKEYDLYGKISMEEAQKIVDEYGIEIDNDTLKQNIALLNQKLQAEQELADLKNAKSENDEERSQWERDKEDAEAAVRAAEKQLADLEEKKKNSYYSTNAEDWTELTKNGHTFYFNEKEGRTVDKNSAIGQQVEEILTAKKTVEDAIDDLENIKAAEPKIIDQVAIDKAQDKVDSLKDTVEKELTLDVQLKLQLQDKNKLVDDIQSVFDTLVGAIKEYNKNGYMSVDTVQSLLELEPKYLALLYNENGNLAINKKTLYDVAEARITNLTLKQLETIATNALTAINQSDTDAMSEQISVIEKADGTLQDFIATQMAAIDSALALKVANGEIEQSFANEYRSGILKQMNATVATANAALKDLANSFSSAGNTATQETEDALEKLLKKYERKIDNLSNQQTQIQNQIDILEAQEKGISKSYYEEQIAIEQNKLKLYEQERAELLAMLNSTKQGTDTWYEIADAIWDTEHAIQESTLKMIEFRQSIIDLYKAAFDDVSGAFGNKNDYFSDYQELISKRQELLDLLDEPASASGYKERIGLEEDKLAANIEKLNSLEQVLKDSVASGYVEEGSDEWIEMQSEIRATTLEIADNKIAIQELIDEMNNIPVDVFNKTREAFEFKDSFLTSQQDYIEGYADYLEAIGVDVPEEVYDKLIEIEQEKRASKVEDLVNARQQFADIEAQGFTAADEEWQDAYNKIVELEKGVQDCDIAIAEWEKTIRELDLDTFERFIDRLNDIQSEIEHLYSLTSKKDVAFEDGTFTKEGITSIGLMYQKMELAKQTSEEYANKIKELNEKFAAGAIEEQEYYETLQTLKEGQWDAIDAYEDAKDAIVDLEEARIDMIEKGIEKEIDAYQELIDLKKDELDAERDLHDFKKSIEDDTKNISTLERRIASMSGSTDAATIAEKMRLEAELREARTNLEDKYYDHSMDAQSNALDDEMTSYQKAKDEYLETLREALEDTERIINEKISAFLLNADTGLSNLNEMSAEYGVTLSDSLTAPWMLASESATAFKDGVTYELPLLTNEDGIVTLTGNYITEKFQEAFGSAGSAATLFKDTCNTVISTVKQTVENSTSSITSKLGYPWNNTSSADGPINTFSRTAAKAINDAKNKAIDNAKETMEYLKQPWVEGKTAVNGFSSSVESALNKAVAKAKDAAAEISRQMSIAYSSYDGGSALTGNSGWDDTGSLSTPEQKKKYYQYSYNDGLYYYQCGSDAQGKDWSSYYFRRSSKIPYGTKLTTDAIETLYYKSGSKFVPTRGMTHPVIYAGKKFVEEYAKGTTGTKKDQWAITDEPQFGDELVMYATPEGRLSYMRAGSTVIPADLTKELMKIGELGISGLQNMGGAIQGINLMSNVINKPEIKLDIENFLHVDNVTQDSLGELKKFAKEQINVMFRQLNYGLK